MQQGAAWRERLGAAGRGPLNAAEARAFAGFALDKVSRTFALNIRVLPEPLRTQVLYAYLYCRMADTIEDDAALPVAEKERLLEAFSAVFDPSWTPAEAGPRFEAFPALLPPGWRAPSVAEDDWERLLLAHAPEVLRAFPAFPAPARAALSRCVREMCAGMADFARRTESREAEGRALIETVEELDAYCYYVAGTVGVMLCELFVAHARIPHDTAARMRALCVSFGLGLQLTNILKDVGDDRERGVSWLPPGVSREALFLKARGHLREALEYSILIPRRERRLRLFCLWPLFMAAETLSLLAESPQAWTGGARAKITRARVKRIVLRTGLLYFSNAWLRAEFRGLLRRLDAALPSNPPNGRPAG
jgi:farnesyl-diphosphate farnesyltransferase